jgi:hypothetical protein
MTNNRRGLIKRNAANIARHTGRLLDRTGTNLYE